LEVDSQGRPVFGWADRSAIHLMRLRRDGGVDLTFGTQGTVTLPCQCTYGGVGDIAFGGAGEIYVEGVQEDSGPPSYGSALFVVRLLPNGEPDSSFSTTFATFPPSFPETSALLSDGTVVTARVRCCGSEGEVIVARIGPDGRVDRRPGDSIFDFLTESGVSPGSWPSSFVAVLPRSSGKVDLVGDTREGHGFVIRLQPDGLLDPSFGHGGFRQLPWGVGAATLDGNGRLLTLGGSAEFGAPAVHRLLANGARDRTFGAGGGVSVPAPELAIGTQIVASSNRPLVLGFELVECRGLCATSPFLVRLKGGNSGAQCFGRHATTVGTRRSEVVVGTSHRDVIAAGAGNDVVRGRGGNDLICGSRGNDRLIGGSGKDRFLGGAGRNQIRQ
jgi:uncharacterized delta-60 repeat protein